MPAPHKRYLTTRFTSSKPNTSPMATPSGVVMPKINILLIKRKSDDQANKTKGVYLIFTKKEEPGSAAEITIEPNPNL